jgi:diacylglycerol kinase family enzyme
MTVLSVDRVRRSRVPQIAFDALLGRDLTKVKGAQVWEGVERVELVADPEMSAQADGESLGKADRALIEWRPAALRMITGP